jgi:hypothetical protein
MGALVPQNNGATPGPPVTALLPVSCHQPDSGPSRRWQWHSGRSVCTRSKKCCACGCAATGRARSRRWWGLDRKTIQRYIAAATQGGRERDAGEGGLDDAVMAKVCERARPRLVRPRLVRPLRGRADRTLSGARRTSRREQRDGCWREAVQASSTPSCGCVAVIWEGQVECRRITRPPF